ncbi:helix-turn-helix domain-containing protein [Clostridium botulinum]|uniref:Putative DNA-binding protein n=1 Tax=Clostridium botulinum (strain Langeland / NCTC 10281 / Type F) TaxID=441772 RepID=A7GDL9_CLOBL|nr:helix-turn-helix transcriptional regulator [Clostridium botulinum]ABS42689.1 putative DNA-binding protein [Clostridium botulinum F str. Langeland]ADF99321.1 putative DNA-binding protein [Clostridium botulinum F str. 230613]KKM43114.1 DNA-binding protein [Clostridium botulinum]MBY6791368.1 helix-turn-helix domain-containing protein [Clostridium botulinum]MBY6936599.1 helix-turn-helix domain-containing protein [Clostridium botulinum]
MEKLLIGEVIYRLRKEKAITQEQLANFVGVSTAAVSKWESGASYPDITLLPVIAAFFNVTIDTLLNFKIELSDEEVMDIFNECEKLFSNGEIHKAIDKSKKYIINYTSSYYLKLRIGFLFIVYSWKSTDEEKCKEMIGYSIKLFEDVSKNCTKIELVEQALFQLGALYPSIGEEDKAVEALNKINKSKVNPDMLLANIYMEKNELKKAREIMQSNLYKSISDITTACFGLANSYMKDEKNLYMVEKYYNLSINIKKIFSPNGDSILELYMEYLSFAQIYLKFNDSKKAIDMLHKMIYDMKKYDINEPENFRDIWCFNEISNGKRTITMNLYENMFKIFEAPEFDLIRKNEEFIGIMNDLKNLEKKSLIGK